MSSLEQKLLARSVVVGCCRIWTGPTNGKGYGKVFHEGKYHSVHRAAWTVWRGPIPDGMDVLHTCDTPLCIAQQHLFLGTQADNVADMMRKGRYRGGGKGEQHPRAILNDHTAKEIFNAEGKQKDIAQRFNVSRATVSKIKVKISWRHIH